MLISRSYSAFRVHIVEGRLCDYEQNICIFFQIANVYCKQNRVERDRVLARGGEREKHVSREVATK